MPDDVVGEVKPLYLICVRIWDFLVRNRICVYRVYRVYRVVASVASIGFGNL